MGWVTLSLRKMVLTQRVSELEHRLTQLSQSQQTLANSSAYTERFIGLEKQQAYSSLTSEYSESLTNVSGIFSNSTTQAADPATLAQYMAEMQQSQIDYMYNKMVVDSVFTQREQALQDEVNEKQTYIQLEQEQVETQLEAARAELEALDEAISSDIKQSTISLV